jgi:hypothetical protein
MKQKMRDEVDFRVAFVSGARRFDSLTEAARQQTTATTRDRRKGRERQVSRLREIAARLRERWREVRRKCRYVFKRMGQGSHE